MTKDSQKVLVCLYHMYLKRIKDGTLKEEAKMFDDDFYKSDKKLSKIRSEDIYEILDELAAAGAIKYYGATGELELTNDTISKMENRFEKGFSEVASFIAQFIP